MRAIIYTRVSTDEQADKGYSLRDQEERLRKYCEIKKIDVVEHFQDDESAKTFNRPEFKKALEFVKRNKRQIDYLLFVKWDRFSRNISEAYKMIEQLKLYGVSCNAAEQWLELDVPENKLLLAIYLATPEIENDRRAMNTRAGMRKAMKEGRWVYSPPKGYRMGRDEQNKPLLMPSADAPLIKKAFELYSTVRYSKCELRNVLVKQGLKISKNQFILCFRNPIHYGKIYIPAYRDEEEMLVQGIHEAIVDEELFNKCQRVEQAHKNNLSKPKAKNDRLPLRGHLTCKICGSALTGSGSSGNGGKYFYYHCQNGCKERFRADEANNTFEQYLSSFKVRPALAEVFLSTMESIFSSKDGERKQELLKLDKQIAEFKEKLIKTDDMFISGNLEKDSYKRMKDHYYREMWGFQERKREFETMDSAFTEFLRWDVNLLTQLPECYQEGNLEVKQKLIGSIFPQKLTFDNGTYRTTYTNGILTLLNKNMKELEKTKVGKITDQSSLVAPPNIEPYTYLNFI